MQSPHLWRSLPCGGPSYVDSLSGEAADARPDSRCADGWVRDSARALILDVHSVDSPACEGVITAWCMLRHRLLLAALCLDQSLQSETSSCVQNAVEVARANVPEHMSPLAALAASERASICPRRRLLWLLQCGAQLESNVARGASDWRKLSLAFDVLCLSTMVSAPMAPAQSALTGRGALPVPFLWAPYMRWLGRLSFGGRCVQTNAAIEPVL